MFDIGDTFFLDFFKWLIFIQGYFLSKESNCAKGSVVGRSRFCRLLRDDEWTSFTWNICLLSLFLLFFSPSWESSSPVTNKSIFTTWPHLPLLPTSAVAPIYTVGFLFLWIYFGAANISVKEHIYFWCYLKRKEPLKYNEISIQEGVGKRGAVTSGREGETTMICPQETKKAKTAVYGLSRQSVREFVKNYMIYSLHDFSFNLGTHSLFDAHKKNI